MNSTNQYDIDAKDRLEMCRFSDSGPYSLDNIYCDTKSNNSKNAWYNHQRDTLGENNSNYGNRGFSNVLSKAVMTPNGLYGSIRDAAREYNITPQGMSKRLKNHSSEYYFID